MPSPPVRPPVRRLDLTDEATAAAVHRIGRASYAVEAALIGFDGIPALRESLQEMRERPLHWSGAVHDEGSIAGFVAWAQEGDGSIGVDRLCVDPAWFRRGIASRLMRHLLTEAFPDRTVEVTTGAANAPAVALYEGLGMVRGADFSPVPDLLMAHFTRPAP
ncbi:GNAT family N-acetyltransferase [Streptomyces sp. NPDC054904]|uniref:GNAT family N-acetyltransferase n=1 Tax=unclassified Streptomyces TaxID=2593676 RepID=UPI002481FAD9|nr:GNAT family N-acetyltransferase [Streptomyces sp. Isolate_45]MDA5281276.1 GNAT family N-acetyltransferase [Streptomyces sp. Isolate_45]